MIEETVGIIGSGPAGLTAAIYLSRAMLHPTLFAGSIFGGQLMLTTQVENFPGFPTGINGPDLMLAMIEQAKMFGTQILYEDVTKVDFAQQPYQVYVNDQVHSFHGLVLATGASAKWLGLDSEHRLIGKGVSSCATCDGAFFKEKVVAVVGGGDSAMEDALFLTRFAQKVYIIHRRDAFRASKIMQEKIFKQEKISVLFNTEVHEILGEEKVSGIRLFNNKTQEEQHMDLDGVFIAIGHTPNTHIFKDFIDVDEHGYISLHDGNKTNLPGIFACGDVDDARYKQAITAAGEGCKAALDLERYLTNNQ